MLNSFVKVRDYYNWAYGELNKSSLTILFLGFLVVFSLADIPNANAAITVYTDKAIFLINTGSTSATGPLPDLGLIAGGAAASQTVGTVTFTITPPSSELYIGAAGKPVVPGLDWTAINPGPDIAISDIENLNVDLSSPVVSLGFDFVESTTGIGCKFTCVDSTFSLTLKNGLTSIGSFQFNAPENVLAFVGVHSDTAFDRVEIRDITANIDDEYFGEFYTSEPLPSDQLIGGVLIPIETTSLLLAGTQMTASWLIPVVVAGSGIVLVFVRKSENS